MKEYVKFTDGNGKVVYGEKEHTQLAKSSVSHTFVAHGSLLRPDGGLKDRWGFNEMETVEPEDLPPKVAKRFGVGPTPDEELVEDVDKALFGKRDVSEATGYEHPVALVEPLNRESAALLTPPDTESLESSGLRIRWMKSDGSFCVERAGGDDE